MLLGFSSFLVVLPLNISSNYSCLGYFKEKNGILRSVKSRELNKNTLHKTVYYLYPHESISTNWS